MVGDDSCGGLYPTLLAHPKCPMPISTQYQEHSRLKRIRTEEVAAEKAIGALSVRRWWRERKRRSTPIERQRGIIWQAAGILREWQVG